MDKNTVGAYEAPFGPQQGDRSSGHEYYDALREDYFRERSSWSHGNNNEPQNIYTANDREQYGDPKARHYSSMPNLELIQDKLHPDVLRLTASEFADALAKHEMTGPRNLILRIEHMDRTGHSKEMYPFLRQVERELRSKNSSVMMSWGIDYRSSMPRGDGSIYGTAQPLEITIGGSKGKRGIAMVTALPYN